VGERMLRDGWATVYEAKSGVEFGGKEELYRRVEEKAKKARRGLWIDGGAGVDGWESPRMFKDRVKAEEKVKGEGEGDGEGKKKMFSSLLFWK